MKEGLYYCNVNECPGVYRYEGDMVERICGDYCWGPTMTVPELKALCSEGHLLKKTEKTEGESNER